MRASFSRCFNGLLISATILAGAASAASASTSYMVQLGSFETEAQAQGHWEKIQARFPELFEPMGYKSKEINLPPDDFVYHRTQAGPISSRGEAEEICNDVLVAGFECYVVETAFSGPATVSLEKEVKTAIKATAPKAPVAIALPKPTPKPTAPIVIATPTDTAASLTALLEEAEDINPVRDNFYAQQRTAAPAPKPAPRIVEKIEVALPTITETDGGISFPEPALQAPIKTAAIAPKAPALELPAPRKLAAMKAQPIAAPAPIAIPAPIAQPIAVAAPQAKVTFTPPSKPVFKQPSGKIPGDAPFQINESRDHISKAAAKIATPATSAYAAPSVTITNAADIRTVANNSKVEVSEAVRVPLSMDPNLKSSPIKRNIRGYKGSPSQSRKKSALWAEVSYFKTQNAALGYWNKIRARDARIPQGLRLRVTRPFLGKKTNNRMSLRVGPFDSVDAIRRLCSTTRPEKLRCRAVKDLGASIATGGVRKRYSAADRFKRKQRHNTANAASRGNATYWIHLGTYGSPQAAQASWNGLKSEHSRQLRSLRQHISSPRLSSSRQTKYRLRAGPFGSSGDAVYRCEQLKNRGARCVVVSDK